MADMTRGTKVALAAGLGVGAYLILSGGNAKAATNTSPANPCQSLIDQANKILPTATKADLATLISLANQAKTSGCIDLEKTIQTKIDTLSAGTPSAPTKPSNLIFDPAKAKDPIRAHNLAIAIGNSPVPPGAPSTINIASDGTYATFADFCHDMPRNGAVGTIMALQDASGISVDGRCGTETTRAWNYWLTHSTRPNGSTSIGGEMDPAKAWGNEVLASIGREKNIDTLGVLMQKASMLGERAVAEKIGEHIVKVAGETAPCTSCGVAKIAGCCSACDASGSSCADMTPSIGYTWGDRFYTWGNGGFWGGSQRGWGGGPYRQQSY